MKRNPFAGRWRIVGMSGWDQDYVDMEVPGHFTFGAGQSGSFQFGLVQGEMDCRFEKAASPPRVEFTWNGFDEGDELNGRGHAAIVDNDELHGRIFVHLGDDSAFRAVRQAATVRKRGTASGANTNTTNSPRSTGCFPAPKWRSCVRSRRVPKSPRSASSTTTNGAT